MDTTNTTATGNENTNHAMANKKEGKEEALAAASATKGEAPTGAAGIPDKMGMVKEGDGTPLGTVQDVLSEADDDKTEVPATPADAEDLFPHPDRPWWSGDGIIG